MTLPPDFLTAPNDFGLAGLLIGGAIGLPLGSYLYPGSRFTWSGVKSYWVMFGCLMLGMFTGEIIRLFSEGYLP
jgi:hypothetical protein